MQRLLNMWMGWMETQLVRLQDRLALALNRYHYKCSLMNNDLDIYCIDSVKPLMMERNIAVFLLCQTWTLFCISVKQITETRILSIQRFLWGLRFSCLHLNSFPPDSLLHALNNPSPSPFVLRPHTPSEGRLPNRSNPLCLPFPP